MTPQTVTVPIEDFGCSGSGALIVERALVNVPGVLRVYVNAATEAAYVKYDADRCTIAALQAAVARTGFHAGMPVVR
jgi:copper chaperone CopZ